MSYQPNAAMPQPFGAPIPPGVPPAAERPKRGKSGLVIGLVLIVAGLAGAAATFLAQKSAYEGSVKNLQRAGSGLSTEFVFEKTGTFTLYYEYKGSFSTSVGGDDQTFESDARDVPRQLKVRLVDSDGKRVRLAASAPDVSYDVGGFAGVAYKQVEITDTGSYTLEVQEKADPFAIAVGAGAVKQPTVVLPIIVAAAGVVLGLLSLLFLGRRKAAAPVAPAGVGGWPPAGPPDPTAAVPTWGASPPGWTGATGVGVPPTGALAGAPGSGVDPAWAPAAPTWPAAPAPPAPAPAWPVTPAWPAAPAPEPPAPAAPASAPAPPDPPPPPPPVQPGSWPPPPA